MDVKAKRFLFYLGHPAHYHNISIVAANLREKGHEILLVARAKDVLFDLLEGTDFNVIYLKPKKGNNKLSLIKTVVKREFKLFSIANKFKPNLLIGTDIVITHVGKLLGIPSIVLNEDDALEVPFLAKYGFKYASKVFSPESCDISPYNHKKFAYKGYHELAYLHPDHFMPDQSKIFGLSEDGKPFFILRFAELTAHHDEGKKGITNELAHQLIDVLSPFGRVYITSERKLEPDLDSYRIKLHPKDIHHALHFAHMYIGDSQTMAAEAAVLGTPSIRFNDFVGKLGYLEELEHKFQLTHGIHTSQPGMLLAKVKELLNVENLNIIYKERRDKMTASCVNVAELWTRCFEAYPNLSDSEK